MKDLNRILKHICGWYMTEKFLFFGSILSTIIIFVLGTFTPIFYKKIGSRVVD